MDNFFKPQNLTLAIKITRLFINPSTKKKKQIFLRKLLGKQMHASLSLFSKLLQLMEKMSLVSLKEAHSQFRILAS